MGELADTLLGGALVLIALGSTALFGWVILWWSGKLD
jgi:hypothetical protein